MTTDDHAGRDILTSADRRHAICTIDSVMLNLIAFAIGAAAAYLPHLLIGDRLSFFADFVLGSAVGGIAYVFAIYKLRKMRGDL